MPTVLITGGTGMIGKRLTQLLVERNYQVIILSRKQSGISHQPTAISYAKWDVERANIEKEAIAKADHIIHLAGANVAEKRWTKERKKEIIESRTKSSALLVSALKNHENKVKTVVSASAIGWYGADIPELVPKRENFVETYPPAHDFLAKTCIAWEESIEPITELGKRLVKLRTGIVLSNEGGALAEFRKPLKYGIATILGSGEQMISWIHVDDLCRMYIHALENESLSGVYNAVAPEPVSNRTLMLALAKKLRDSKFKTIRVPAILLKMILGEMSVEVLKGATVYCHKIKNAGFTFLYPSLEDALKQLISQKS